MQSLDIHLQAVLSNHDVLNLFQGLPAVKLPHECPDSRKFRTWDRKVAIRRDAAHGVNLFGAGATSMEQPHTHIVE